MHRVCGTLRGSQVEPLASFNIIPGHTHPKAIPKPKIVLRDHDAFLGRFAVPLQSFAVILRDAMSSEVTQTEIELCRSHSLFRRLSVPLRRCGVILASALPLIIQAP